MDKMKRTLIFCSTIFLLAVTSYAQVSARDANNVPPQGNMIGGVGADGKYHFLLVSNTGALNATVTGAGDASAANQTAVQANAGSSASKALFVQGGASGLPLAVKIDQTTPGTTNAVSVQTAKGATNYANSQVTTSTTAGTLVIARATRRSCLIKNTDATITVYIGAATVTSGNGMPIKAGESVSITAVGLWQVIAASGTPVVAVTDEYD